MAWQGQWEGTDRSWTGERRAPVGSLWRLRHRSPHCHPDGMCYKRWHSLESGRVEGSRWGEGGWGLHVKAKKWACGAQLGRACLL